MAVAALTYALGRDCQLTVGGKVMRSAEDVYVRENVVSVGATVRNSSVSVAIPVQRSLEIDFSLVGTDEVKYVFDLRTILVAGSVQPNIVVVSLAGGVFNDTALFTIHDTIGDEPLNGAVRARFSLRQWLGMKAGGAGTAGNATPPASLDVALSKLVNP